MSDGQKLGLKVRRKEGDVETTFMVAEWKIQEYYWMMLELGSRENNTFTSVILGYSIIWAGGSFSEGGWKDVAKVDRDSMGPI